jgi:hypothetical protein
LRVDQQQLMEAVAVRVGGDSQQKYAQIVTAGVAGKMLEIRLPIGCSMGSSFDLEIQGVTAAGLPDSNILSSRAVEPGLLSDSKRMHPIPLASPVPVTIGSRFAIVLKAATTATCAVSLGPPGDQYLGGKAYYDARPNVPGWAESDSDLAFQTLVSP